MSEEHEAVIVIVSGKVQGVFFRSSMKRVAEANNVVGWVRNLENGDVEALVQGRKSDVESVLRWCHAGPARAQVDNVETTQTKVELAIRNFTVVF